MEDPIKFFFAKMHLKFIGSQELISSADILAGFTIVIQAASLFLAAWAAWFGIKKNPFVTSSRAQIFLVIGGCISVILMGVDTELALFYDENPPIWPSIISFLGYAFLGFFVVYPCVLRYRGRPVGTPGYMLTTLGIFYVLIGEGIFGTLTFMEEPQHWLAVCGMVWYFTLIGLLGLFLCGVLCYSGKNKEIGFLLYSLLTLISLVVYASFYFVENSYGRIAEFGAEFVIALCLLGIFLTVRSEIIEANYEQLGTNLEDISNESKTKKTVYF